MYNVNLLNFTFVFIWHLYLDLLICLTTDENNWNLHSCRVAKYTMEILVCNDNFESAMRNL